MGHCGDIMELAFICTWLLRQRNENVSTKKEVIYFSRKKKKKNGQPYADQFLNISVIFNCFILINLKYFCSFVTDKPKLLTTVYC